MRRLFVLLLFVSYASVIYCQNIAITDDDAYTANSSAMLDVYSLTKGMLVPRLTTTQRSAIVSPATGLLVFDTTINGFYYYNGTSWINLTSGSSSGLFWSYSNSNIFMTNSNDSLGIGTNNPLHKIHLYQSVATTDGTNGALIDVQNYNTSTGVMSGIRLGTGTTGSPDNFKGGIFFQRNGTYNRGDLIFANNSTASSTDVTSADGRLVLQNDGRTMIKGDPNSGVNIAIFAVQNSDGDTIFAVYPEGVRVWVNDDGLSKASGNRGGFAVGGFSPSKAGFTNEYLRVTPDSVRVYIEEGTTGSKTNGSRGGFAVGGFAPAKGMTDYYFNIEYDTTEVINPSEPRMLWYPNKEAFLSGRVLVQSVDSVGTNSMATGYESKSIGNFSQAFGYHARAKGNNSTAIGNYANANANNSFAFGDSAQARGAGSYAFGAVGRDASGNSTGNPTIASGNYSVAMGMGSTASGLSSFSFGTNTIASASYSTAFGFQTISSGTGSVAFGRQDTASGAYSIAAGYGAKASSSYSYAFGYIAKATNTYTFAAGYNARAVNTGSIALGRDSYSSGSNGVAIGYSATASSDGIALGRNSNAGVWSFAAGLACDASGLASMALGWGSTASGGYSKAIGPITASGMYTFAIALNDQSATTVASDNVMSIMGGKVGIGYTAPFAELHVQGNTYVSGNLGMATIDFGGGNKVISIEAGTVPTASAVNAVLLYASGTNAELRVRDELGNITVLSPHNFDYIPKSEPMAWSYHCENEDLGQRIDVDMLKTVRLIESISGEQLVHISDLKTNKTEFVANKGMSLIDKINMQQKLIDQMIEKDKENTETINKLRSEIEEIKIFIDNSTNKH